MNGIFKTVFEKSFTGCIVADPTTLDCFNINLSAQETLGYLSLEESADLKLNLRTMFSDVKKGNVVNFEEKLLAQDGFYQEAAMKKIDGANFYVELSIKHIVDEQNKKVLLVMFRDITFQLKLRREISNKQEEIAKAYKEILDQNKELMMLDKAKDKFIALTSHELRTPLSAMVATAEVLSMKLYDSEEQLHEYIHTIFDQGKYLLTIVNDILDFSKIQAGKIDLYVSLQDPEELVKKVVELFENFAKEKNIKLVITPCGEAGKCYFDYVRLRQVISNLLSNAIKFSKAETSVEVKIETDEEYTSICVIDKGPGIPKESQDKIFNEFETLQNINTHHKGTGLGLPISKRLAQLQGGGIDLISDVDQGATFIVKVPKNKVLEEGSYQERNMTDLDDLAA